MARKIAFVKNQNHCAGSSSSWAGKFAGGIARCRRCACLAFECTHFSEALPAFFLCINLDFGLQGFAAFASLFQFDLGLLLVAAIDLLPLLFLRVS